MNINSGTCSVEKCVKPAKCRGMCSMHDSRVRRRGSPHAFIPQKDRNLPRGESHWSWTGESVTNRAMHQRIKKIKGSASEYACASCGVPADHWSYDHADPDEKKSAAGPYSLDVEHYRPLCVTCHKRFDNTINPVKPKPVDPNEIQRMHAEGIRVTPMAKLLGVGTGRINRELDRMGLPRFRPGSPGKRKKQPLAPDGGIAA